MLSVNYLLRQNCLQELKNIFTEISNIDKTFPIWLTESCFQKNVFLQISPHINEPSHLDYIINTLIAQGFIKERISTSDINNYRGVIYEVTDSLCFNSDLNLKEIRGLTDNDIDFIRKLLLVHKQAGNFGDRILGFCKKYYEKLSENLSNNLTLRDL